MEVMPYIFVYAYGEGSGRADILYMPESETAITLTGHPIGKPCPNPPPLASGLPTALDLIGSLCPA